MVYGETQKANFDDLGVVILDATGEDDDGKVSMNTLLVVNEAQNKVVMLLRVATPESAPKHADENRALVNSFCAAKAEEEVTTGLVAYTAKVRKQSFASDVLFNDLINGETGIGAADKFFFPDAEVRKVTEIKVEVPYNNKETGVEHWTVQHDGKGSSTYILKLNPDGHGGTTWSIAQKP